MDITGEIKEYAEKEYEDRIKEILLNQDGCRHYSISVDTLSLFAANVIFAHLLFESPTKALKMLDDGFQKAAESIWKKRNMTSKVTFKNIHARLTALPNLPEIYRCIFPNCYDAGQFMCLCGTVIRTTAPRVLEYKKLWKCTKCKHSFTIEAKVNQYYVSEKPTACPNPEWCNNKSFTLLSRDIDPLCCKDYQEMKIQEQAYNLSIGSIPQSMCIILEDDLVDNCQAGNDVIISGVLIQRWKPLVKGKFIDIELVLFAHNVEVKNKLMPDVVSENLVNEFGLFWMENKNDPLKGRDFILSSICPQIFGLYIVKLAVALILAGGVEKKDENSRIRGDSHLLLVGDPGTGKSQFLKFASKVSMRSVLTSGIGTTNAGLTVSAVKESGKWQLEAGALVLADGGICCIDEFSCIKENDKTCIHEAMEQQTISVAKAGLVCRLSTRCSILAATNPKGKYDNQLSLSENTALGSPLLSRFDIILVLLDTYDEKWDDMVASYILEGSNLLDQKKSKSVWPISKIRNYFSLIRHIKPKVTPACEKVLQTYYTRQRSLAERNYARTTPRLLQSLIRLAEGHARLMFRYDVLVVDAIVAILVVESSMSESSILSGLSTLHTSFPDDTNLEYAKNAKTILELLKLENLLKESKNFRDGINLQKLLLDINGTSNSQSTSAVSSSYHAAAHFSANVQSGYENKKRQDCFSPQNNTHPNVADDECPKIIQELIASFNEETPKNSDTEILRHGLVNIGLDDDKNDEVSTLADLNNIFHENFIASDATSESFDKIFKKKKTSQSTSNTLQKQCAENSSYRQNPKATEAPVASSGRSFSSFGKSSSLSGRSPPKKKTLLHEVSELKTAKFSEIRNQNENKNSLDSNLMISAMNNSHPSNNSKPSASLLQKKLSDNNRPSTSLLQQKLPTETAQIKCNITEGVCIQSVERHEHQMSPNDFAKSEYFEPVDNVRPHFFKGKHSMSATNISLSKQHHEPPNEENQINKSSEAEGRDFAHKSEISKGANLKNQETFSKKETSTTLVSKSFDFNSDTSKLCLRDAIPLNCSTPLPIDNNSVSGKHNSSVNDDFQSKIKNKLAKYALQKDKSKDIDKICQPGPSNIVMAERNAVKNNNSRQIPHTSSARILNKNIKETLVETTINTDSKERQLFDCSNRLIQPSQFSQATFKRVFTDAVDVPDNNIFDDLDIEELFDL